MAQAEIDAIYAKYRRLYLEALHSLKVSVEREIKDFEHDPFSVPSVSIKARARSVTRESCRLSVAIEASEATQEE